MRHDNNNDRIEKIDKTDNINMWTVPGQVYFCDNIIKNKESHNNNDNNNDNSNDNRKSIEEYAETKRLNRISKKFNIPKGLTSLVKNLKIDGNDIVILINDSKTMYERINKVDSITKWKMTKTMIICLINMLNEIFIAFRGITVIFASNHEIYYENVRQSQEIESIFAEHGFNFKETRLTDCARFVIEQKNTKSNEIIIFTSEIPRNNGNNDELNFIRLLQSKPKICRTSIILLSISRDVTKYYKGVIDDLYKIIDKSITSIAVLEEYNNEHSKLLKLDDNFMTFNYTYNSHIMIGLLLPYFENVYDIYNIVCEKRVNETKSHETTKLCIII